MKETDLDFEAGPDPTQVPAGPPYYYPDGAYSKDPMIGGVPDEGDSE